MKFYGFCRKTGILCLETVAVAAGLSALFAGFFIWRLSTGPLNVDFIKDQISQSLSWPSRGISVSVEHVVLEWTDFNQPILLGLKDVRIIKNGRKDIISVDEVGLSFSLTHLFIGRIDPKAVVLRRPSLRVVRSADNTLQFGFEEQFQDGTPPETSVQEEKDFGAALTRALQIWSGKGGRDEASAYAPLLSLRSLEIERASLMIEDHVVGVSWFLPKAGFIFSRNRDGASVSVDIDIPGGRVPGRLRARADYDAESQDLDAHATLEGFDPGLFVGKFDSLSWLEGQDVVVNAKLSGQFGAGLSVKGLRLKADVQNGVLSLPDLYANPRPFDSLKLSASYDPGHNVVQIDQSLAIEGMEMQAEGFAGLAEDKITVPVRLSIADMPLDKLQAVFPDRLEGTEGHHWLVKSMKNGRFQNVKADVNLAFDRASRSVEVTEASADFDFDGVSVDYRPPLMPATNAGGHGHFDTKTDTLLIDNARATVGGGLKASNAVLKFSGLSVVGGGMADLAADVQGPLSVALKYVAEEPIAFGGGLNARPEDIEGQTDLKVNVSFPTVKDMKKDEVKVIVKGTLNDVKLPDAVKNLTLTGGPLALKAEDGSFSVGGAAKLAGRDVQMEWQEFFSPEGHPYTGQVTAKIAADKELRDYFGAGLDDYISGTVPVDVVYTSYADHRADIAIKADLAPVRLMFAPLGYDKAPGEPASAVAKALLRGGVLQEVAGLGVQGPKLKLDGGDLAFRQQGEQTLLQKGSVAHLVAGDTDAAVNFEFDQNDRMNLVVKGSSIDATAILSDDKKDGDYAGPAMTISAAANKIHTQPGTTVEQAKVYVDMARDGQINQLEMDAKAGRGLIYLRLKPDAQGKQKLRLEADDAGAALRAFGIYDNVQGGKLTVSGAPMNKSQKSGDLTGTIRLDNFKVVNAPVLARLLSAMSLPGLLQLLGNEGVNFSRLEGQFDWMYRSKGSLIVLRDGRTSGNALGLTFEGAVDRASGTTDMSGTIVPISDLNSLIANIPLVGDILAGGANGAVFAATYTVKGPSKEPKVSVNPLAALTPGILRKILFE